MRNDRFLRHFDITWWLSYYLELDDFIRKCEIKSNVLNMTHLNV